MAGFWSQSNTGHLDHISLVLPHAIRHTGTGICTGQNVGATCRRPLISEDVSNREEDNFEISKRPNHTECQTDQSSPTPYFQTFLQGQIPTLACAQVLEGNTVQINTCLDWFHCGQNIRLCEIRQSLFYKAGGKE